MTVTNSTITGNNANGSGGGMHNTGSATLTNNIVSGNSAYANIRPRSSAAAGPSVASDNIVGTAALLGPLGNYGGPTPTFPLLPGSPAIGAGTTGAGIPTTDQRGVARTGRTDIGAFQSQGFTLTKTGGDNQSQQIGRPLPAPLALTVAAIAAGAPYHEPVAGGTLIVTPPAGGASASLTGSPDTLPANGQVSMTATANTVAGGP